MGFLRTSILCLGLVAIAISMDIPNRGVAGNRGPPSGNRGPPSGNRGPPNGNRGPPNGNRGPPNGNRGPPEQKPTPTPAPPMKSTTEDTSGRLLKLPDPEMCAKRPRHFHHGKHAYFYSDKEEQWHMKKYDWLMGRNICREYCMDLVSIETPSEDDMIRDFILTEELPYIWTSGRLCDFTGCDRADLQPVNVNGWFWSGSGVKMAPTNSTPPGWPYQPWSDTGHKTKLMGRKVAQPDNAEWDINETAESCMGILNDIYEDGIKWHDIACYHTKPFLCEDSDELLEYARATRPDLQILS